jgi:hypothetical protein
MMLQKITNEHDEFLSKSSSLSSLYDNNALQVSELNPYKILGIPEPPPK